ncbi:hypothetical protein EDC01DRAFT_791258 [Geopyxis carbonaria]|nr:hypothetical protein EDC01DRAFT_791258 [Geopyxis carbonaria]
MKLILSSYPTFCLSHVSACISGYKQSSVALAAAGALFPANTLHNGRGDAFRHCYWSALMTIDVGASEAKAVGDAHEAEGANPPQEKAMDLANNASGRSVGAATTGATETRYVKARAECERRARAGQLVTLF